MIQNQRDENKRWYDLKMAEDYTQRSDAQNILRKQRELLNEQYQRARATNIVAGGTDESLAMQQAAANDAMGDTMAEIASQSSAYKEGIEEQYRAKDASLNQQLAGIEQQKGDTIAQAAGQMGNAVSGLVQGGMTKTKTTKSATPNEALMLDPDAVANEILAEDEIKKYKA